MTVIQARVIHAMTIPFTLQLASDTASAAQLATLIDTVTPRVADFLRQVETTFSPFRSDSQVTAARHGDWSPLLADASDHHLPQSAAQGQRPSRHAGITLAPDGTRRTQSAFAEVYALMEQAKGLTHGHFDPMHAGAYDPTGIVKGWAVERAHEQFLMPLIKSGQCDAAALGGGGDIQTAVADTSDFTWNIGVQDPSNPHGTVRTVTMRNGGIATSGTSQRGEHITRSTHDLTQATVIGDHLTFADMWATTAISAGERTFRELVAANPAAQNDLMAVFIRADGTVSELKPGRSTPPSTNRPALS
ncbi:FAD:protein FMN transferase [Bifidobacterium scaligerum]|uniref:FAD:protein FMN transferase n=1 Tax=Bifidobacterium scaligerum TaxID=2052656 RepID=A0A2M9HNH1_9BIFI|nr:FAD:protein FMN transferase [Bifidobacterium scaligerum]PJM78373.1 hypothetical protein CUU80_09925 [Bifidobacterium scaligerum]